MNKTIKRAVIRSRTNSEFYNLKNREPKEAKKEQPKTKVEPGLLGSLKESLNK